MMVTMRSTRMALWSKQGFCLEFFAHSLIDLVQRKVLIFAF